MDLITARTEIRMRLGEDAEDFFKDADILRALNEAQRRFYSEEKWPWLQTEVTAVVVAANVATFALKDNVDITRQFSLMMTPSGQTMPIDGPARVDPSRGMELRRRLYSPTTSPLFYYLVSMALTGLAGSKKETPTIRWVPVPTKQHAMDYLYFRLPAALTADADELDMPEQYVEAVLSWATANMWLKELNGGTKAQEQFNIYNAVLGQARNETLSQAEDDLLTWGGEQPAYAGDMRDPAWPPQLGP